MYGIALTSENLLGLAWELEKLPNQTLGTFSAFFDFYFFFHKYTFVPFIRILSHGVRITTHEGFIKCKSRKFIQTHEVIKLYF